MEALKSTVRLSATDRLYQARTRDELHRSMRFMVAETDLDEVAVVLRVCREEGALDKRIALRMERLLFSARQKLEEFRP